MMYVWYAVSVASPSGRWVCNTGYFTTISINVQVANSNDLIKVISSNKVSIFFRRIEVSKASANSLSYNHTCTYTHNT